MLRVQKKKSMLSRKLDKGMMLGLTRTAIRKKGAVGYGKKIGMGHGKDWTHKDVRKVLEYMYERKAFSNKIDTRERSVKFLERAGMIELGEKFEERMVDLVEDYLYQLFERHKILPENANAKRELIANFKTTMELFLQRHENLVSEVHKFSEDKRKTKTKFYDVVNARDAFAHIVAFPMEGIVEDVLEATRVVEKRILKK